MASRGKRGVVTILAVTTIVLGLVVGCDESQEPPAVPEPNEAAVQQPTHDQIAGVPALKANASDLKATVVTPHMAVPLEPDKNVLWCATFQMAWNELADLLGDRLAEYRSSSEMVPLLNQRSVTKDDLDEASYVALAGYPTGGPNGILNRITAALAEKFAGTASPRLLPGRDVLAPTDWLAYAYLFKSLPFEWAFVRNRFRGISFSGRRVQTFGIWQLLHDDKSEAKAAQQVCIYDIRDVNDFILELKTRSESDRLILAKVAPGETLEETVQAVHTRLASADPKPMYELSDLQIPVLDFDIFRDYSDLLNSGWAAQHIRFKLDETGAVLKSEGAAVTCVCPNLIFDKPFLVMLQRKDAANPYFALWVANAELLVPVEDKP